MALETGATGNDVVLPLRYPDDNIPVTAEEVAAMAADSSQILLQSLGLRVRAPQPDADPRRARGVKREVFLGK